MDSHAHGHGHSHGSGHGHGHDGHGHMHAVPAGRTFLIGLVINALFVIFEIAASFYTHSLALLTDAGHNLSDVAALGLAWMAARLAAARPTVHFTYGYQKTTVLAALANSLLLFAASGGIVREAVLRLAEPAQVHAGEVTVVALMGIVVNAGTALLFFRDRHTDLNASGAFTHLAADAAVSAGVAISGVAIAFTGLLWLDPAASFVIVAVILYSAWSILRRAVRLSLDGVPHNVTLDQVLAAARRVNGVEDLHHVHIWALSTTQNAMTAHVVVNAGAAGSDIVRIKKNLRHEFLHENIHHATLEFESSPEDCGDTPC